MITVHDLELRLGKRFTLRVPELALSRPLVLLLGPNGSGKSTLLYLLAGLHRPGKGTLRMGQALVPDVRREVAFALGSTYYPAGWNYAEASRYERSLRPDDALVAIRHELEGAFGLAEFARKPLRDLSAGMGQKANLCLALHGDPHYLLLDEPESHLDQEAQAAMLAATEAVIGRGIQVICATHLPILWQALANKVEAQALTFPLS